MGAAGEGLPIRQAASMAFRPEKGALIPSCSPTGVAGDMKRSSNQHPHSGGVHGDGDKQGQDQLNGQAAYITAIMPSVVPVSSFSREPCTNLLISTRTFLSPAGERQTKARRLGCGAGSMFSQAGSPGLRCHVVTEREVAMTLVDAHGIGWCAKRTGKEPRGRRAER